MAIHMATFAAVSVSAAQDLFEIVAPAAIKVDIREIRIGQYSDFGDSSAELLSLRIIRGYTTSGSGGSSVTPVKREAASVLTAATTTVEANNTTVAQDGTAEVLLADSFNVAGGFRYYPVPEERIRLQAGERLVVRIAAPADALTMNGTVVFEELGVDPRGHI